MITGEQQRSIGEICRALSRRLETGAKKPGPFLKELIKTFPDPSPLQKKIIRETRQAFGKASEAEQARPIMEEIVDVICGWGDTLEEGEVLAHLQAITEHGSYTKSAGI
ncbi:MAG: hypothetical protein ABJB09_05580 [Verrucomicrobiota bacterium]